MNTDVRPFVVVDLIGDLDASLVATLAETLAAAGPGGRADVLLSTRHLAGTSSEGLAALSAALRGAFARGASIDVDAGNRKMRFALANAGIDCAGRDLPRPRGARHVMIARHAEAAHLRRSA